MNELGEEVTKVNTVDYQTLPGKEEEKRDVQVTHTYRPEENPTTTVAGVVVGAVSSAGEAFQAAKDSVTGK